MFLAVLTAKGGDQHISLFWGPRFKNLGSLFMRHSGTDVTDNGAGQGYPSFADVPRRQSEGEARPPVARLAALPFMFATSKRTARGGLGCGPASPCAPRARLLCKMDEVRGTDSVPTNRTEPRVTKLGDLAENAAFERAIAARPR